MTMRAAGRTLAAASLVVLTGALAGCTQSEAGSLADYDARTRVLLMLNHLKGRLAPGGEVVYILAVDGPNEKIDVMKAPVTSREGELVLRIHVVPEGSGLGAGEATTRCYRYQLGSVDAATPHPVRCPTTPPVAVPTTDVFFRLPADTPQRLRTTLKALSATESRSLDSVKSALARAFPEKTLWTDAAAAPDGAIGVSVATPFDAHVDNFGQECALGRIAPGGAIEIWDAETLKRDPSIECSARLAAVGALATPSATPSGDAPTPSG